MQAVAAFKRVALLAVVLQTLGVRLLRLDHVQPLQALLEKRLLEDGGLLFLLRNLFFILAPQLLSLDVKLALKL